MIKRTEFNIAELTQKDALSLSTLMVSNAERFRRFFPLTLAQNLTVADSEAYILKKQGEIKSKTEFTFAIKEKEFRTLVGLVILKELDWTKKQGELAYCIDQKHEGKGWMTHSVDQISKHTFNELGLQTLQIIAHKSNIGSIKVAEKCGYKWQKTLPKAYTPPNEVPLDMELYEFRTCEA
ncbi:MAG: GNAT family protein [Saonia sp.]